MKFRNFGQLLLATALPLATGLGLIGCTNRTIDYVYVTTSKNSPGQVVAYAADSQSGTLTALRTSVFTAGINPVAEAISPNQQNLYVVNHDDPANAVIAYTINGDGTLTQLHAYSTPGTLPTGVAINAAGTFLYVVDTYQPGFSAALPGKGAVVVFPVATDGSLGTPVTNTGVTPSVPYFPVGNTPTSVAVPPSDASVYVVNKGDATISAFNTASGGGLALVSTVPAGTAPSAIAIDPTSRFVYITDSAASQLIAYAIQPSGTLNTVTNNGPFPAGNFPDGVTVDPRGQYLYVANFNDSTVAAYALDQSTGSPTRVASVASITTGTGPTCVIVEPSLGLYVYTSNFRDNTITGLKLNIHSGAVTSIQNTPYNIPSGAAQPTCIAAITHGNHATQHVQP